MESHFGLYDYIVLCFVLIISASIGVYYRFTGGKQKTNQEYLLADGSMSSLPVAFSLMASFMSAITILGVSSENYTFGIQFIIINISYGIFTPVAAYLYLPVFFKLQATSTYEYLDRRFGQGARLAASLCYTLQMFLYMGIVLYAPALALEALTGISKHAAILTVGLVCTFYSTIGGMKAVLITDVFQSLLMFAAVFSIIIFAIIDKGSVSEIWRIASEGNRTEIWNFDPDPTVRHSWFTLIIGGGVTFLSLYGVNQTQVQRYLTVKNLKAAQRSLWLNWPILTLLSLSTSFSGIAIYSKFFKCDPVSAKLITSNDQLMPYYVITTMGEIPGLAGLFVAGIFSASFSTVSSSLNSLAAVTIEDYCKPLYKYCFKTPLKESVIPLTTKLIAMSYGLGCVAIAFLAQYLGSVLQASLTIFGVVGGPLLALFTLGMFTIGANQKGALTGLVCGLSLALWMAFGSPRPKPKTLGFSTEECDFPSFNANRNSTIFTSKNISGEEDYFWLYKVSYLYHGVMGTLSTFIIGYIASIIFSYLDKSPKKVVDPNLYVSYIAKQLEREQTELLTIKKFQFPETNHGLES